MNCSYDMVLVPEGSFIMGTDRALESDAELDEMPVRNVWLSSYQILRRPVTVGQWNEFLLDTRYDWTFQPEIALVSPGDNYPITQVSWYDCCEFTKWVGDRFGRVCSLPTEAQWEKACRGCEGQLYPWGNEEWDMTDEIVRATSQRLKSIAKLLGKEQESEVDYELINEYPMNYPVGWRPEAQSPYGCLDMWMNVGEWCLDWFDYYDRQELIRENPSGPPTGAGRVIRGGRVYMDGWPRCSYRRGSHSQPEDRSGSIGFRVVTTAP